MSVEYQYDPESGSFKPKEAPAKKDDDWKSWVLIAAFFATGLWPLGLFFLISKLKDSPRRDYTASPKKETVKTNQKVAQAARKMTRSPDASRRAETLLIGFGIAMSAVFALGLGSMIMEAGFQGVPTTAGDLFAAAGFFAASLSMLFAGLRMKKRNARMPRYAAALGERDYILITELMTVVGKKRRTVERDLEFMIEKGMLGTQAYVDSGRGILFRSAEAAQRYAAEHGEKENLTPREVNEGYAGALRAIRYANDRIADPVLSEKIDHLETVAGKIFKAVEKNPEKRVQADTFFNYYLPTTLKILNTYAEFEAAGIEGENLQHARERIEETMDMLVKGFDKQLDDLYRSEAMDIDSEIRVMENMLRRDISSVSEDFGLGGVSAQRKKE